MTTLQEIANKHHSGYLRSTKSKDNNVVFSFCNGRLGDVRQNGMILASIDTIMDSGKDASYIITDKLGNSCRGMEDSDYRIKLGYK